MITGRRAFLRSAISVAATGPLLCRAQGLGVCSGHAVGEPVLESPSEDSVGVAWSVSRLSTGAVEIADNPEMKNARTVKSGELPLACLDEGEVKGGELVVSVRDTWRDRIVSTRTFKARPTC